MIHQQVHNGRFTTGGARGSMRGGGMQHPGACLARPGAGSSGRPGELPFLYVHPRVCGASWPG